MIVPKWLRHLLCYFAVIGMVLPVRPSWAVEPDASRLRMGPHTEATDVSLTEDGLLRGRVVDRHGNGLAESAVRVIHQAQVVTEAKSDATGTFRVPGLTTGVYQLVHDNRVRVCRVWTPAVAPPSAQPSVQLVTDNPITAGQCTPLKWWLADPLVVAGIAAIAIAVPVAIHNQSQDNDSGS